MGLEAIINAGTRKARLKNRWFYWKYKDEVDEIRRKSSDWMGDQNDNGTGGTGGFAIGRRIYEKQEIDMDEKPGANRESKLMDQKYNLRYAKEDFQLWDHVHGKDVIKQLEQNQVKARGVFFRRWPLNSRTKKTGKLKKPAKLGQNWAKFEEKLKILPANRHFDQRI